MKISKNVLKKSNLVLSLLLFPLLLPGCASIVQGQNQSVSVKTTPIIGARCALENNKGKWLVPSTPGKVTIHRSYHDLKITCRKKGYRLTEKMIASSTTPMVFGNVIAGGIVGAGIDIATGSAYAYPNEISVPM